MLGCFPGLSAIRVSGSLLVSCPRNKHIFRCDQNGPPARRSEPDWQWEGAYPERYVTDEQRGRRPIFIATLRAAASWLFFRVARSSRIDLDMLVARALKNSQRTGGERHAYFADRTLGELGFKEAVGLASRELRGEQSPGIIRIARKSRERFGSRDFRTDQAAAVLPGCALARRSAVY